MLINKKSLNFSRWAERKTVDLSLRLGSMHPLLFSYFPRLLFYLFLLSRTKPLSSSYGEAKVERTDVLHCVFCVFFFLCFALETYERSLDSDFLGNGRIWDASKLLFSHEIRTSINVIKQLNANRDLFQTFLNFPHLRLCIWTVQMNQYKEWNFLTLFRRYYKIPSKNVLFLGFHSVKFKQ